MSYEILKNHRKVWDQKKVLRNIYKDWYRLITKYIVYDGLSVEIGGGGGNFKEFFPEIITTDFTFCEWIDLSCDAHELPFRSSSLANVIMIDVLHHLECPLLFFYEIQRVLKTGGRLILLEPYISFFSFFIYNYLHQEDVEFKQNVFARQRTLKTQKKNFDGNSAISSIIFFKELQRFQQEFNHLKIIKKRLLSFILYPLSGGYSRKSLVPNFTIPYFKFLERLLRPFGETFAFRVFVVIQKEKHH